MSIIDRMGVQDRSLTYKRPDDPHGPKVSLTYEHKDAPEYFNGYTYESAYRTELKVETLWYANQVQFSGRRDLAHKELLHFLYSPVLRRLVELRSRVADRDWREVMRVVDELEKELVE